LLQAKKMSSSDPLKGFTPPLGIVAGGGQFPLLCIKAAKKKGIKTIVVAHKGDTDSAIEAEADKTKWVYLGQLGKLIKTFKKAGVQKVVFAGTITKKNIFKDIRPDFRALNLWRKLDKRLDDAILRAVAKELESEGMEVISATHLLTDLAAPAGILTRRSPSKEEKEDIKFGWEIAKRIGEMDIGQCVVVKDRVVLAVEALEGTDNTIRRGGELGKTGVVVVKICKPNQDHRFDLPSVGIKTIQTMKEVKASVLAIEAGKTLIFDRKAMLELADQAGICVIAVQDKEMEC